MIKTQQTDPEIPPKDKTRTVHDSSADKTPSRLSRTSVVEYSTAILVWLILLIYTLGYLGNAPYKGFSINTESIIKEIYVEQESSSPLMIGDKIIDFTTLSFNKSTGNSYVPVFNQLQPGESVVFKVARGTTTMEIRWTIPGFNRLEFLDRMSYIWIPYSFWFFGMLTALLIRPKNVRWRLLALFNYLTGIWLIALIASTEAVATSPEVYRVVMWFCIPVYLHLYWVFPKSLGSLPRLIIYGAYLLSLVAIIAEIFLVLPEFAAITGLGIAVLCSIILIIFHWLLQADQRPTLKFLIFSYVLVAVPTLIIGGFLILDRPIFYSSRALLTLPVVPLTYFYITARRQMAGLELRINQIITLLLFGILISSIILPVGLITQIAFSTARISYVNTLAIVIVVSLLAISIYPKFQQWVERNFLSITIKFEGLVEEYTARITTSLGENQLVDLLKNEIFPSMLIRQVVLLRAERNADNLDEPYSTDILIQEVEDGSIPTSQDIKRLLSQSGRYIPKSGLVYQENNLFTWIRLITPLRFENRLIGVCLFGRRDPDDYYSPSDIQALQAIMSQTALALVNIDQAKHLHALYQDDIRRHEIERHRLARDLHDVVLNDLAIMAQCMDKEEGIEDFDRVYNNSVHHIREIIRNLRPAMLQYGLKPAFDALVDELYMLPTRDENGTPLIEVTIPFCQQRYPDEVELHVFRIVQQACENALKHANANTIRISGRLSDDSIGILVKDDGVGLQIDGAINLEMLLAKQHYGLAGMHERAAIINANIEFLSNEGSGTSMVLIWNKGQAEPLTG